MKLQMSRAFIVLLLACAPALAFETDALTRDPSTILKRDGVYWVYGTGKGTQQFSSTDRVHWTKHGPVLPTAPAWVAAAVPANKDNGVWAPDVHKIKDKYYLYYSYSTFGSNISGIGVATNETLEPTKWVDQGVVINSTAQDHFNAIDPCIFEDAEGKYWLTFGSYFSGIKLVSINPATGKRADDKIYNLATRPDTPPNAIEAPAVEFHDGYYYLFVNWDNCCAGGRSAYNIRVGRSKNVTGPYVDKAGKDMMVGGGTLFLNAIYDDGSGRVVDDQIGPGHVGILHDRDGDWVSTHYEWARDKKGATTMNLNKLAWDSDGWPRVVLDSGPYKIVSNTGTHGVASVIGDAQNSGALLETSTNKNLESQKWTLNYRGDGYYQIINARSKKALALVGCDAKPGAKVELVAPQNADCQSWYFQQNEDGTYTLLTKVSNKAVALDVAGCGLLDGTPIQTWTSNGLNCQKWTLRQR